MSQTCSSFVLQTDDKGFVTKAEMNGVDLLQFGLTHIHINIDGENKRHRISMVATAREVDVTAEIPAENITIFTV